MNNNVIIFACFLLLDPHFVVNASSRADFKMQSQKDCCKLTLVTTMHSVLFVLTLKTRKIFAPVSPVSCARTFAYPLRDRRTGANVVKVSSCWPMANLVNSQLSLTGNFSHASVM